MSHKLTGTWLKGLTAGTFLLYKQGGMGEGFLNGEFTHKRNDLLWVTAIPYVKYVRPFAHGLVHRVEIR